MLIGDTNARTASANDFIMHDILHDNVLRDLSDVLFYGLDTCIQSRTNPDTVVNDLGNKLLSLCKSSGLRILNGRHNLGMDKDYTFVGPRGMSVVDYVITTPDVFSKIDQFIVANFTMYSDHAPLHIRLKSKQQIISNSTVLSDSEIQLSSHFVWNQDMIHQARSALIENSDDLVTCFQNTLCETQSSIDESVDLFTLRLTDLMRPFFETNKSFPKPVHNSGGARSHSCVKSPDKPWFNEDLKKNTGYIDQHSLVLIIQKAVLTI